MENRLSNKTKAMSIFWWTIRRYIPVSIAYWVMLFVGLPVAELFAGFLGASVNNLDEVGVFAFNFADYVDIVSEAVPMLVGTEFTMITIVFSTIISMIAFSYMHNKRSVDFFGSLPVSRKTMFFSRYMAVIGLITVPVIVMGTVGALLTFNLEAMFIIFEYIIYILIAVVGNITVIAFLSLCCGSTVDIIISFIALNIAYPICVAILNAFPQVVVPGLGDDIWPVSVYTLGSPVASAFTMIYGNEKWIGVTWWLLVIVILTIGNIFVCNRRKAEMAQDTYTFSAVEYVIKFVVCILAGFGLGWLFSLAGLVFKTVIAQYLFFMLGMVIGIMVANLLLHLMFHRGLSCYGRSLIECALVAVICVLYLGAVGSGLWGTDIAMPELSEIEAVSLTDGYVEEFYVKGKNVLETYEKDQATIEQIYDIHKEIIEKDLTVKEGGLYPLSGIGLYNEVVTDGFTNYETYSTAEIIYKLKNGETFKRYYVYEELLDVVIDENLYTGSVDFDYFDLIPTDYASGIWVYAGSVEEYGYGYNNIYLYEGDSSREIKDIVEAFKKDYELYGKISSEDSCYVIEIEYTDAKFNWVSQTMNFNDSYVNTIEAFANAGYENLTLDIINEGYFYSDDNSLYIKEGYDIYFNLPEGWDPDEEIYCMQGFNWSGEYVFPLESKNTICKKVDENTWKYTVYEYDDYSDRKKTFNFFQKKDDKYICTGELKMPKNTDVNTLTIGEKISDADCSYYGEELYSYEWSMKN